MGYTITQQLYRIGQRVEKSGMYLCVPCGYAQHFEAGGNFTTCEACLAGTENGHEGYHDPQSEFWQFIG